MKRIDTINARPDVNGVGKKGFHDNADLSGQDATYISPDWLNHIQEELCNLLEKNGVTLNSNVRDQLYQLIATNADIDALAIATQQKIDDEELARENEDNNLNQRIDDLLSTFFYKNLSVATTVYPLHYNTNPTNYDAVLISAYYQPAGVLKQTIKVHATTGDANLHIYLPIAASTILHIGTTYQSAGDGTKGDDDSYSRLVNVYEEGTTGNKKTVIVVRTDYVSDAASNSGDRWIWVEVTCAGFTQNVSDLNSYPYSRSN